MAAICIFGARCVTPVPAKQDHIHHEQGGNRSGYAEQFGMIDGGGDPRHPRTDSGKCGELP